VLYSPRTREQTSISQPIIMISLPFRPFKKREQAKNKRNKLPLKLKNRPLLSQSHK